MFADAELTRSDALFLVAANAVPLAGVVAWGWSTAQILAVYWVETGVATLLAMAYLLTFAVEADGPVDEGRQHLDVSWRTVRAGLSEATFVVYAIVPAWLITGGLLYDLVSTTGALDGTGIAALLASVTPAVLAVVASHVARFGLNCRRRGQPQHSRVLVRCADPVNRLIVLWGTAFVGIAVLLSTGSGAVLVLVPFVACKTAIDVYLEASAESDAETAETPADAPAPESSEEAT